MIEQMKALAKEKDICVLATVSGGIPHCSLMAYVTDDDCREIFMATHKQTVKYANLIENPSVSLLIDTREEHSGSHRRETKALTVSGVFQTIGNTEKKKCVRATLLERHPHLKTFLANPDAEIFGIKIKSFLLLDGLTNAHFEGLDQAK